MSRAPRIASLLLLLAGSAAAQDDTAFFSSQIAPNVVLIFDNSGSMNHIVWHPAFRPDGVYDPILCPYIADPEDPDFDPRCLKEPLCAISVGDTLLTGVGDGWGTEDYQTELGGTATKCGNVREIFQDPDVWADGNLTLWDLDYLRWYFSDNVELDHDGDGTLILDEIVATNNGSRSQCVIDSGKSPTYSLYRRARVTAAKDITREVICNTNETADIRYGLATFFTKTFFGFPLDPEGGWVNVPVADYTTAHASALENAIEAIEGETLTPLAETLYNVYRYFQSRTASKTVLGKDGTTRFPVYSLNTAGDVGTAPVSPGLNECQKHFVILITDGEPTFDDFADPLFGTDKAPPTKTVFLDDLIGDYKDPGDEVEEPGGLLLPGFYLDDVAAFMQENDLYPDEVAFPGTQTIDTYTVGFTTNATANDLLDRTAQAGNGRFFFSNNAEELTEALTQALNEIVVKSKAFTAATIPASRASDGNNFFTAYFNPSTDEAFWQGHLKLFEFSALGEIRDKPATPGGTGDCALVDPQAPRCQAGPLNLTLDGYWDAADEIPAASARALYVSRYRDADGGPPASVPSAPLAFGSAQIDAAHLGVAAADIPAYSAVGNGTAGIAGAEDLADALVRYGRGCEFGAGACADRGDGQKLWDIFHSAPIVVGPPNKGLRAQTYREFIQRYKHRKRVVYAGSNGGFLHGFNAGEFGTTAAPSGYDRGTGAEEFGFMAYPARQSLKQLPLNKPRTVYTMDGLHSAADVWLPPSATANPDDDCLPGLGCGSDWNHWRTALVGGMRQGGRVVYALDVTNPPDHDSPSGEQSSGPGYPEYLWEFPCEASSCDAWRPYMGETWSRPVITRVRVTVNCSDLVGPPPCPTYDRWVAIFGAGYDTAGDPNRPHESDSWDVQVGEYDASCNPPADASCGTSTSRAGRAVLMVDIGTGQVLAAKRFQHDGGAGNPANGEPGMQYAMPGAPAVFDLDRDGYADVVYIGDLGGNLWKWVIRAPGEDHIRGSAGSDHQARWPFLRVLAAEACTTCSPEHYKSFFFPPTGARVGANLWLALGSGERTDLDYGQDGGLAAAERNRFYVFRDADPFERERDPAVLPYTDAAGSPDFDDVSSLTGGNPNTCFSPDAVGFYVEGEDGEKFITESTIFFGVVLTASYVPAPSTASACQAVGEGFLHAFNLLCGAPVFPDPQGSPGDPDVRRISVGGGLPNPPRTSVGMGSGGGGGGGGGGPCADVVLVITSEGRAFSDCEFERPDKGTSVKSWRDRDD